LNQDDLLKQFSFDSERTEQDDHLAGFIDIENEYITFRLGEEFYAVEIIKIKEIRSLMEITPVPKMPPYIKGVINLRGDIVPVIDLAVKLNFTGIVYGEFSVIIVIEIENRSIGILAEEVLDVMGIPKEKISERVDVGSHMQSEFIKGIANIDELPMMIIDIKKLIDIENIKAVE
jgi:purine-binding chemotaxis protein CheW